MERWLLLFFIGACCALLLEQVPALYYLLLLALSCFCVAILTCFYKKLLPVLAWLFGFAYILFAASAHFSWSDNNKLDAKTLHLSELLIQGTVQTLIVGGNEDLRFNVEIQSINSQLLKQPFGARITFKQANIVLSQGDIVQLLVKVKPAHGFANQGSFSYQKWLLQNHLVVTGYVKKSSLNMVLEKSTSVRQALYNQLNKNLKQTLKPLILALSLGDKSQIDNPMWQVLQTTGTQHLMAISGLHLGLIAGFGFTLAKLIIWLLPKPLLSQRYLYLYPMIVSLVFACIYSYLAGFSMPTIRALIMLLWFYGLRIFCIKVTIIKWLLLSLCTIILIDPFAIFDASLYLSFSAVLVILFSFWRWGYLFVNRPKWQKMFLSLLLLQIAISLLLMPLTLLLFNKVSIVAPLANIIVVPWLSFTAIPTILIATLTLPIMPSLALWLFDIANYCLELGMDYLSWLAAFEYSTVSFSTPVLVIICLTPLTIFLQTLRLIHPKWVFISLLPTLVSIIGVEIGVQYWQKSNKYWLMTIFDVGHGVAVLIERNGEAILYDTGAAYPSGFNFVEAVIKPYLLTNRIDKIDLAIISHRDNDHAGGLPFLQKYNLVKSFSVNFSDLENNIPCTAGKFINWQGLTLKVLSPNNKVGTHNDESCVIEITDGKYKVLLPGDISNKVELQLLHNELLSKVDVLLAPHHGSKSSSSFSFVQFVQPKYVLYSSGFLNRWDMPVKEVVERYQQISAIELNTSIVGMVQFTFTKQGITYKTYRDNLLPFWPWQ
ncbi:DNA internalization-related competence protein ComEC/Rec2 [Thalassotalea psychrophila]|uniref:DNA internalization-related competence protein ComEC/Rec2 n=1 Tax=Thalassotalea psychrophila TaxID=3065647 RepID=A0ABY9TY18_9GAMM|nr:DNA internalization-related competence protein ComEC/Rec2 [Colwelliaceae bacterium SQ149]